MIAAAHGRSGRAKIKFHARTVRRGLARLLDHVNWPRVTLGVARWAAASRRRCRAYPTAVQALALIDTTAWYGQPHEGLARARRTAATKGFPGLSAFQATRWVSDAFREAHPQLIRANLDVFSPMISTGYTATCEMLGDADLRHYQSSLRMPTASSSVKRITRHRSRCPSQSKGPSGRDAVGLAERVRHLTPIECPAAIAEKILAFDRAGARYLIRPSNCPRAGLRAEFMQADKRPINNETGESLCQSHNAEPVSGASAVPSQHSHRIPRGWPHWFALGADVGLSSVRARVVMGSRNLSRAFPRVDPLSCHPGPRGTYGAEFRIMIGASYVGRLGALAFSGRRAVWPRPLAPRGNAILRADESRLRWRVEFCVLLICRFIQGIGVGGEMPVAAPNISELFPCPTGRGRFFMTV